MNFVFFSDDYSESTSTEESFTDTRQSERYDGSLFEKLSQTFLDHDDNN